MLKSLIDFFKPRRYAWVSLPNGGLIKVPAEVPAMIEEEIANSPTMEMIRLEAEARGILPGHIIHCVTRRAKECGGMNT